MKQPVSATAVQFGFLFCANQPFKALNAAQIDAWEPSQGLLWTHWNASDPRTIEQLQKRLNMTPLMAKRFCNIKAHPAFIPLKDSFYLILHSTKLEAAGHNTSTHFYCSENQILSVANELSPTVMDMKSAIEEGECYTCMDQFIAALTARMAHNLYRNLDVMEEQVDKLTKVSLTKNNEALRSQIASMRRDIITTRQYLSPACDAFLELSHTPMTWLSENTSHLLQLLSEQYTHVLQGLDSALARAAITHEELVTQITVQLDRRMFTLAVVATIFLPLSFLVGLFGVNLGGMPGIHYSWSFTILALSCLALAVLGIVPAWFILRHRKR